jgi:homogentisate 1,2-dioxygenase
MSRNNILSKDITLHPKGIPHGPAPSYGTHRSYETHELAVMVDTFRPLMVTEEAMELDMVSITNLGSSNEPISSSSAFISFLD